MIDRRLYIKSLKAVFSSNQQMATIVRQTKQLAMAKIIIDKYLPPSLAQQTTSFSYKNQRLTLTVPNSAWLAKLRFYVPELLAVFRNDEEFSSLKKIHLKVVPLPKQFSSPASRRIKPISEQNTKMLQENADSMEEGPLKKALLKLAKNSSKTKGTLT